MNTIVKIKFGSHLYGTNTPTSDTDCKGWGVIRRREGRGDRSAYFHSHKRNDKSNQETYYVCCDRMVEFKNTLKEAYGIYSRIHAAYGDRARMAETNEGIDWKALSHAVRVANEALELLETHKITFPLPNAAHILDIKQGKLPYKEVAEEIEGLLIAVETASLSSTLPAEADQQFIDDLVETVYLGVVLNG